MQLGYLLMENTQCLSLVTRFARALFNTAMSNLFPVKDLKLM
jgi:hypothetical protein